jgi:hypothetical protein
MRWRGTHTLIHGLNRPKSREMAGGPDTCADGPYPAHCAKHPISNGRQSLSVLALSPEGGRPRPLIFRKILPGVGPRGKGRFCANTSGFWAFGPGCPQ